MNKLIFKVVGAAAVSALFCVGCSEKPDEGGDLVGDWSAVSREYNGEVDQIPDNYKMFYSFSSSNIVPTQFQKVSDFWIESKDEGFPYTIKGDSICAYDDECINYSISGNTLTLSSSGEDCYDEGSGYRCHTYSSKQVFARGNLASTRASLGKVYSQDPALNYTEWTRESESEDEWDRDRIEFWGSFYDNNGVYISRDDEDYYDAVWYTEGSSLTLVALECERYETVKEDDYEWERCVAQSVSKTVKLDYQLSGETLRLKAPGGGWDEWTPYVYDYNYMSKAKAKAKAQKGKCAVGLFQAFRR